MTPDRPTIIVLGVVLVLVFGTGAATLNATVTNTGGGDETSGDTGTPVEDDDTDLLNVSDGIFPEDEMWLEESNDSGAEESTAVESGSGGGDSGQDRFVPEFPTYGFVLIAAVFLAVIGLLVGRSQSGESSGGSAADDDPGNQDVLTDVGATAGEAADELATGASPENVVYRTWLEMTRHLDVDRRSSRTPGEFADAATEAGMRPDDVRTLTDVFEQVRYGDQPVTDERRRRAREALRHIEATYGEGGDTE